MRFALLTFLVGALLAIGANAADPVGFFYAISEKGTSSQLVRIRPDGIVLGQPHTLTVTNGGWTPFSVDGITIDEDGTLWAVGDRPNEDRDYLLRFLDPLNSGAVEATLLQLSNGALLTENWCLGTWADDDLVVWSAGSGDVGYIFDAHTLTHVWTGDDPQNGKCVGTAKALGSPADNTTFWQMEGASNGGPQNTGQLWEITWNGGAVTNAGYKGVVRYGSGTHAHGIQSLAKVPGGNLWSISYNPIQLVEINSSAVIIAQKNIIGTTMSDASGLTYVPDCNGDGIPDMSELDCDGNGTPDSCEISANPSLDCDEDGVLDVCVPPADCDMDGTCDFVEVQLVDCNGNGIVDDCEVDCDGNGVPDDCDIAQDPALDCDGDLLLDSCFPPADCDSDGICDVAELLLGDCNSNGIPDDCELAGNDCNNDGIPDDCQPSEDCNGNGIPDLCELETLADCDGDLVPDVCEADCNANGLPDDCEGLPDCNGDGTPDECQPDQLSVTGFVAGSPTGGPTTGGASVTFAGEHFLPGTSVTLHTPSASFAVSAGSISTTIDGNELSVVLPPIPPGCDCALQTVFLVDVSFDNGCGTARLSDSGAYLSLVVSRLDVLPTDDLQAAIDGSPRGTCVVLQSDTFSHSGPIALSASHRDLTLTSETPNSPGATTVTGNGGVGFPPPPEPTLTLDGVGSDVCVDGLNFILGNSGVEVRGAASPTIRSCKLDDNIADTAQGGGLTIREGSTPLVTDCDIVFNQTAGSGGGVLVLQSSPSLLNNSIVGNDAATSGGGLYLEDTGPGTVVRGNDIRLNPFSGTLQDGGGVYWTGGGFLQESGQLVNNLIAQNEADRFGAGVFLDVDVYPLISGNCVRDNAGLEPESRGGGLYVSANNTNPMTICENVFVGNSAQVGGGLYLLNKLEAALERNFILCNRAVQLFVCEDPPCGPPPASFAAGLYTTDNDITLRHNTIWGNVGVAEISAYSQSGGIHAESMIAGDPNLDSNLVVGNEGFEFYASIDFPDFGGTLDANLFYDASDPANLHSSLAHPTNLVAADPELVAPDCELLDPWAEAWMNFAPGALSLALGAAHDGQDIGAVVSSTFAPGACIPAASTDCDDDGISDADALAAGLDVDVNLNGVPDSCEASFATTSSSFSVASGGGTDFEIFLGPSSAGELYAVLGSLSPGSLPIGGAVIPLSLDDYFLHTITSANIPPLSNTIGALDATGSASAQFFLPPNAFPALTGVTMQHATIRIELPSGTVPFVSSALPLVWLP